MIAEQSREEFHRKVVLTGNAPVRILLLNHQSILQLAKHRSKLGVLEFLIGIELVRCEV